VVNERMPAFGTPVGVSAWFAEGAQVPETDFVCYLEVPDESISWEGHYETHLSGLRAQSGYQGYWVEAKAVLSLGEPPAGHQWPRGTYRLHVLRAGGYAPDGMCAPSWSFPITCDGGTDGDCHGGGDGTGGPGGAGGPGGGGPGGPWPPVGPTIGHRRWQVPQ
jgi:hypothetical protein